jgi:predicted flap endonuclease-1-like 5' DNA nuclease
MLKKSYSKAKPVCKVTFTLPVTAVQGGTDVRILGDFNEWSWERGFRMKAGKTEFTTEVELEAGKEYQFRYLIDNHIWENDWNADSYVAAPFGVYNSVVSLAAIATTNGNGAAEKAAAKTKVADEKAAPAVKTKVAETKPAESKAAVAKPTAKPVAPKAAAKMAIDDLTKIEGIGPKIAELLKNAGIVTFADLSKAKVVTLKGILEAAGKRFHMHDPATWAEQATLAAKGDWAKLEKLQQALNAGKR